MNGTSAKRANLLSAPADLSHRGEHFIDRQLGAQGLLVAPCGVVQVVAVETVGQFFADEVREQEPASPDFDVFVNQRETK